MSWMNSATEALADRTVESVSQDLFDDKFIKWARVPDPNDPAKTKTFDVRQMIEELDPAHTGEKTGHVAYGIGYFHGSQYVHSLPQSIHQIVLELDDEDVYSLKERPRSELAAFAIQQSNIWMLIAVSAVNDFTAAGLDEEIKEIVELTKLDAVPAKSAKRERP